MKKNFKECKEIFENYSNGKMTEKYFNNCMLCRFFNKKNRHERLSYTCLLRLRRKGSSTWSNPCWVSIG